VVHRPTLERGEHTVLIRVRIAGPSSSPTAASTSALLTEIKRRAGAGARFALMVPAESGKDADWTLDEAARLVGQACHSDVERVDCGADAAATITQLVEEGRYADILLSTAHEHHHRWLHRDLPHTVEKLGVAVTVIPPEPDKWEPIEGWPPQYSPHAVESFGAY
jgi:hypothetical protein